MEEKKRTPEDIIKGLSFCSAGGEKCPKCPFRLTRTTCEFEALTEAAVELIQRLQSEKALLEEDYKNCDECRLSAEEKVKEFSKQNDNLQSQVNMLMEKCLREYAEGYEEGRFFTGASNRSK